MAEPILMITPDKIVRKLQTMHATVTTAESCTGGMVASAIIDVPGASWILEEAYVTYANQSKHHLLDVSEKTLDTVGPVSADCAHQMAVGVRERAGADFGIATTGIAGPDGGTEETPVGTVFIACSCSGGTIVRRFCFTGDRTAVRRKATHRALTLLWECMCRVEDS